VFQDISSGKKKLDGIIDIVDRKLIEIDRARCLETFPRGKKLDEFIKIVVECNDVKRSGDRSHDRPCDP